MVKFTVSEAQSIDGDNVLSCDLETQGESYGNIVISYDALNLLRGPHGAEVLAVLKQAFDDASISG